jgi:hypothetical protein
MVSKEYRERGTTIQTSVENLSWKNSKYFGLTGVVGLILPWVVLRSSHEK